MQISKYRLAGMIALASGRIRCVESRAGRACREEAVRGTAASADGGLEEIRELLVAYGRNFDKRDFAAYANLFAKDGVWVGGAQGAQSYQGPDAIREMVEKGYQPRASSPARITSCRASRSSSPGADTAKAWSRWMFVVNGVHNEPVIFRGGYYEDALVREDGTLEIQAPRRGNRSDDRPINVANKCANKCAKNVGGHVGDMSSRHFVGAAGLAALAASVSASAQGTCQRKHQACTRPLGGGAASHVRALLEHWPLGPRR